MLIHILHAWRGAQRPLSEVPKATPRFDDSLGGLRTLHRVSHTHGCDLLCQKDTEQNQQREKVPGAKSGEHWEQASRVPSQKRRTGRAEVPQHWVVTVCAKCCRPTELVRNSVSRIFTGGCSQRHLLPGRYPNSRPPEKGKYFMWTTSCVQTAQAQCAGLIS